MQNNFKRAQTAFKTKIYTNVNKGEFQFGIVCVHASVFQSLPFTTCYILTNKSEYASALRLHTAKLDCSNIVRSHIPVCETGEQTSRQHQAGQQQ